MNDINKKITKLIKPGTKMYIFILVIFAAVTTYFHFELGLAEFVVILVLIIYAMVIDRHSKRELENYITSITYDVETAKNDTLLNFPLPMVVFRLDTNHIVWANQIFFDIFEKKPSFEMQMTDLVPEFSGKWLMEGKNTASQLLEVQGHKYQLHGNIIRGEEDDGTHGFMGITYWVDITEYDDIRQDFHDSQPVVMLIVLDNYDEMQKNISERERSDIRGKTDDVITEWCSGRDAILRRYDRDRYFYFFEQRHLQEMIDGKFSIVEQMHSVVNASGIQATVSIGIGTDGVSFEENMSFASLSIEMALSRGGDQTVIKDRFSFNFYGGRGTEIETRTKVKSRVMANALSELISDASQTFVMGHKYADMDSLGGAVGALCIARAQGSIGRIVINMEKNACTPLINVLRQNPEYRDAFISPDEAMLLADNKSLLIVVDTNRPEQVEDENLLLACNRVAVIDHHRRAATYIQNAALSFEEPYASSVCELMTELLQELVEQSDILRCEAEAMMAGITMDTKNFTIRTGERTFDAAAFLRRAGADTTEVKKLLQSDLDKTVSRYKILQSAKKYRDSIAVAAPDFPQDQVVAAQAADELLNISGVEASVVIYPTVEGNVKLSARSIGDVNVQVLMEKLGGGGNKSAAAAVIKEIDLREGVNRLFKAIDEYFDD